MCIQELRPTRLAIDGCGAGGPIRCERERLRCIDNVVSPFVCAFERVALWQSPCIGHCIVGGSQQVTRVPFSFCCAGFAGGLVPPKCTVPGRVGAVKDMLKNRMPWSHKRILHLIGTLSKNRALLTYPPDPRRC